MTTLNILCNQFGIDPIIAELVNHYEIKLKKQFDELDSIKAHNHYKIIGAMQDAKLDATHFNWTTGYGYDDVGRDKVELIYSKIFKTEDALVRPTIVSGTHALSLTMAAMTHPGDEIISATGTPYDTLLKVIGINGNAPGNLKEYGIDYKEIDLIDKKSIDLELLYSKISEKTKLIMMQRSTGYSDRSAISLAELKRAIEDIKKNYPDIPIMIDNCYGEFVDFEEPSEYGADLIVGSLIKNPGGGLAMTGGYIVGKHEYVDRIANRSTAPGIGKECGLTFGTTRNTLQGLFMAPIVVNGALKGTLLYANIFNDLGYNVVPAIDEKRSDIIQAIELREPEKVIAFCKGIQASSPVDSFVTPLPWAMPGYTEDVIMAAGAFIQGSSIELSADAPMREPYFVYFQGGLTFEHSKLGLMKALNEMLEKEQLSIQDIEKLL
jgi:cystathionine beta-lyase family protein involved in aluminum resistance